MTSGGFWQEISHLSSLAARSIISVSNRFWMRYSNLAPEPSAFEKNGTLLQPRNESFTGFVFQLQANMDPRHRDRMAFLRILSGRFEKDMTAYHSRLQREVRLAQACRILAREREPVREAFAGDIIGVINPALFVIGDTVTTGEPGGAH